VITLSGFYCIRVFYHLVLTGLHYGSSYHLAYTIKLTKSKLPCYKFIEIYSTQNWFLLSFCYINQFDSFSKVITFLGFHCTSKNNSADFFQLALLLGLRTPGLYDNLFNFVSLKNRSCALFSVEHISKEKKSAVFLGRCT
jgi:hypothetical protein